MYYFVVNPTSRTGLGVEYWKRIQPVLEEKKIAYKVIFSKKIGHVEDIVRELCKRIKKKIHIVILGGDGTVNEAIQGIDDFDKVTVSYIPTGSSNDLARDMGISRNPEEALDSILQAKREIYMDMGLVHYEEAFVDGIKTVIPDRKFMVGCGIGFDAAVCEEAMHSRFKATLNKMRLGKLTYLGIALKQLIQSELVDGTVTFDENEKIDIKGLFFMVGMVHRYEGGGFKFCPDAKTDDGLLDFCIASNATRLKVLRILPTAFKGNHIKFKEIKMFRAKKAVIETQKPMWVQTDGEVKTQAKKIFLSDLGKKIHFIY